MKKVIVLEPTACGQECAVVRQTFSTEPNVQFIPADSEDGRRIASNMNVLVTDKPKVIIITDAGEVTVNDGAGQTQQQPIQQQPAQ